MYFFSPVPSFAWRSDRIFFSHVISLPTCKYPAAVIVQGGFFPRQRDLQGLRVEISNLLASFFLHGHGELQAGPPSAGPDFSPGWRHVPSPVKRPAGQGAGSSGLPELQPVGAIKGKSFAWS